MPFRETLKALTRDLTVYTMPVLANIIQYHRHNNNNCWIQHNIKLNTIQKISILYYGKRLNYFKSPPNRARLLTTSWADISPT